MLMSKTLMNTRRRTLVAPNLFPLFNHTSLDKMDRCSDIYFNIHSKLSSATVGRISQVCEKVQNDLQGMDMKQDQMLSLPFRQQHHVEALRKYC